MTVSEPSSSVSAEVFFKSIPLIGRVRRPDSLKTETRAPSIRVCRIGISTERSRLTVTGCAIWYSNRSPTSDPSAAAAPHAQRVGGDADGLLQAADIERHADAGRAHGRHAHARDDGRLEAGGFDL